MRSHALLLTAAAAVLFAAAPALAQQPAPERQNPDDIPTLTTEDVAPAETAAPEEDGVVTAGSYDDPSLTPEERADAASSAAEPKQEPAKGARKGPSPAELQWRRELAEAERRSRAATAAAQNAEIELTRMRNRLASTSTTDERNETAAAIEQQGQRIRELQQQAAAEKMALDRIKAEGKSRRFSAGAGPAPTTKGGRPNPDYYRDRYAKAQQDLRDAERRAALYQNRVSDLRTRINVNSGSGDQFTQMPLQTQLDEALRELEKAQSDLELSTQRVDEARRAAGTAGVPVPR